MNDLECELCDAKFTDGGLVPVCNLCWNSMALERDRYKSVLEWIQGQTDLFFAECTQAEEIIRRVKNALQRSNEK